MERKKVILLAAAFLTMGPAPNAEEQYFRTKGIILAQKTDDENLKINEKEEQFDEGANRKQLEEESQKQLEETKKRQEEELKKEEKTPKETKRSIIQKQLKEQRLRKEKAKELNALREASADTSEYTVTPGSVELVVEMDPNGYGFRTRDHHMVFASEVDFILRGRGMLHYDYRFFNYLSFGITGGVDWSDLSLYSRFRDYLARPAPKQFSLLGGFTAKWRLTEWYMRSAVFLEPSLLVGHLWQTLITETTHWRLRPGIFAGIETIFDSGLVLLTRLGVEFPYDFAEENPYKEVAEPLFIMGLGFAI